MPNELLLLFSVHSNFDSIGISAVDIREEVLRGRLYGGTGTLYRKSLAQAVLVVATSDPIGCRLLSYHCAVCINFMFICQPTLMMVKA